MAQHVLGAFFGTYPRPLPEQIVVSQDLFVWNVGAVLATEVPRECYNCGGRISGGWPRSFLLLFTMGGCAVFASGATILWQATAMIAPLGVSVSVGTVLATCMYLFARSSHVPLCHQCP